MNKNPVKAADGSGRGLVLLGLLLAIGLSAMDASIVATAVPAIAAALGGLTQFPWVFSAYLLATAATIPLYGRLADQFGRKRLLMTGSAIFVIGSVASGFSWNMPALILFRAIQGVGAGALMPLSMTIVGDLYTVEERARIQGVLASVWGISAVLGPFAGGLFTQYLTWRWIFFVNLPVGIAAIAVIAAFLHERPQRRAVRIDYLGAALLIVGLGAVMLALLQAGNAWRWSDPRTLAAGAGGVIVMALFVAREQRAANPIFPLWILGNRTFAGATLAMMVIGLITLGLSAYLPMLAQAVFGATPILAGGLLGIISIAWVAAATVSGRLYMKIGFRSTAVIGAIIAGCGALTLSLLDQGTVIWLLAVGSAAIGFGFGFISSPLMVGAQSIVDWGRRGVVTGAVNFGQSFGSTISTALLGSVFNTTLVRWIAGAPLSLRALLPTPDHAVDALRSSTTTSHVVSYLREGLSLAVHHVEIGILVAAVVGLAIIVFVVPRRFQPVSETHGAEGPARQIEDTRDMGPAASRAADAA
jgi:EmrB/QacA subfamily drug resistance transporter